MNWNAFLKNGLSLRHKALMWRERNIITKYDLRTISMRQKQYLNFSSNDYLGLSMNPQIIKAWKKAVDKYGISACSSSHIIGYSHAHAQLEHELADWLGFQRALLFTSGYAANQCVIFTLMNKNDYIIGDKLNHASLQEAAMLSPAYFKRFLHNNYEHLNLLLSNKLKRIKTLVITEGVFSMDGDTASLSNIRRICNNHNAYLFVDDAHGIGIRGDEGKGSCYLYNIQPELLLITFGKAFGLSGAALLCNNSIAEYFLQYGKHLIYSTFISSAQASALSEAIIQIKQADTLRINLNNNIKYFSELTKYYNLPVTYSTTAIQPLIVGDNQRCLYLSKFLASRGLLVQAIRPPTVPVGSARLRISLSANHLQSDITKLVETLHEFFKQKIN